MKMVRLVRIIKQVLLILVCIATIYISCNILLHLLHRQSFRMRNVKPRLLATKRFIGAGSTNILQPITESSDKRRFKDGNTMDITDEATKKRQSTGEISKLNYFGKENHNSHVLHHERFDETEGNQTNRKLPEPDVVSYPPLVFGNDGAGLMGEAVVIDSHLLTESKRQQFDEGYRLHGFNLFVSDMISVDRPLPDTRNPLCLNQTYPSDLPDTSVIICFLNEAWSVLVRSVHSVINTSPPHLLREIILVDDFSDYEYLKSPLESYMKRFSKVRIIRNGKREGLIRSRLTGALQATAKVLTFLDSHIECIIGWLPPLLARINENSSHVVWPEIPDLDRNTFEVRAKSQRNTYSVGTFDWNLNFRWDIPGPDALNERESVISPLKSPTMAGGLFSIDRDYFYKMGSYDEQMDFWGAENLELSFRIWMCGGRIEVIPCSVIFHIYRKQNPNRSPMNDRSLRRNTLRMANVWMDDYKDIYFQYTRHSNRSYGDIRSRLELRKNLKCHNFTWYIENVYPTLFLPTKALSKGNVRSVGNPTYCLHADKEKVNSMVYLADCKQSRQQVFYQTASDELRQMTMCVDVGKRNPFLYPCHHGNGNQKLVYKQDRTFYHPSSNRCITWEANDDKLILDRCDGSDFQTWEWTTQPQLLE